MEAQAQAQAQAQARLFRFAPQLKPKVRGVIITFTAGPSRIGQWLLKILQPQPRL